MSPMSPMSPIPRMSPLSLVALVALLSPVVADRTRCDIGHRPELSLRLAWEREEPGALLVTNGGHWGHWGDAQFCPEEAFVVGFQLKVQPYQGFFGDDTGLNGVRLLCDTGTHTVTSSVGPFGDWTPPELCPPGERVVSFRLRVEPSQGLWDDAAATDVAAMCTGGSRLEGGGLPRGEWGQWSERCAPACSVCGVRARVEPAKGGDNSGLNDLKMYCCT